MKIRSPYSDLTEPRLSRSEPLLPAPSPWTLPRLPRRPLLGGSPGFFLRALGFGIVCICGIVISIDCIDTRVI